MSTEATYDARKYKVCAPWYGQRGPAWTLLFKPSFENGLRTFKDKFTNYHNFLVPQTDYGGANGLAHPGGVGAAINIESVCARTNRIEETYGLIMIHIENEDIRDGIRTHVAMVLTGAPTAAAAAMAAAGGAVAVGVAGVLPDDWVTQLWVWIDATYGRPAQTGLTTNNNDNLWTTAKISDVGINRDTPRKWYSHLVRLNRQRQVQKTPLEVWIKYLDSYKFPKLLVDESIRQMQQPTYIIPPGLMNAGGVDLPALVTAYEELWHTIYDRGIEIKPAPPPRPMGSPSNRVDGMVVNRHDVNSVDFDWVLSGDMTEADLHEAFIVRSEDGSEAFAFLKDERNCWKCRGWGHTKERCPSVARSRPLSGVIIGLQQLQSTQNDRLNSMRNRRPVRRAGTSPGYTRTPSATTNGNLVEYDDGGIFTADGQMVSPPRDPRVAPVEPAASTPTPTTTVDATMVSGVPANASVSAVAQALAQPPECEPAVEPGAAPVDTTQAASATVTPITHQNIDAAIERDFMSASGLSATEQPDPFVKIVPPATSGTSMALKIACGVAMGIGMCAAFVRSGRGKALLACIALATPASSFVISDPVTVHSSEYARQSRYAAFDVERNNSGTPCPSREHGIMDTGTTECTSGGSP